MNGDDLFSHLSKPSSSNKGKKRSLVVEKTTSKNDDVSTKEEDKDVKRRKIETETKTNSTTIIHRHQLKGGAGTQSKHCVHEVALPPNSKLVEDELLAATSEQP